jgi:hypothetical protein
VIVPEATILPVIFSVLPLKLRLVDAVAALVDPSDNNTLPSPGLNIVLNPIPEVPEVPVDPDVPELPAVPEDPALPAGPDVPDVPFDPFCPDVPLDPFVPAEPNPPDVE